MRRASPRRCAGSRRTPSPEAFILRASDGSAFAYTTGFNANGIVSLVRGRLLVVVQSNTGKLFRIDTRTRGVSEIAVEGATLTNGDGLVAKGNRLYVLRNAVNEIVELKLLRNRRGARHVRTIRSDAFMFPTTAARDGRRLLVVNAQFDKRPTGSPVLPFTVSTVTVRSSVRRAGPAPPSAPQARVE